MLNNKLKGKEFKHYILLYNMKKRGKEITIAILVIITLIFGIINFLFKIDNIPISSTVSIYTKLGFFYFFIFTIFAIILYIINKNRR